MLNSWGLTTALCLMGLPIFPICGTLHTEGAVPSSLALYQEPPSNFKEPSTPRLNSIIVKSKPYSVNDSLQLLHQALDGKTWRREVPVTLMTSTTNMADTTTVTTQATTSGQELATVQQYLVDCTEDKTCPETTTQGPTFRPYSQEELDKFLQKASVAGVQQTSPRTAGDKDAFLEETDQPTNKLANLYIEDEAVNILETTPEPGGTSSGQDKSKSWNLVNSQTHKHPYDDRNGWVSLEPIPWSLSQIQKWEPNPHTRPQIPSWSSSSSSHQHSPGWSSSSSSSSRPPQSDYGKPSWVKPTYDYRPQESYHKPSSWSQASPKPTQHGPPPGWGGATGDIITDGHPGYFPAEKPCYQEQGPSASFHRPQVIYKDQYNDQQSSAPNGGGDGDGRWVLLSSTKGYSFPQRQRSTGRRALRLEAPAPDADADGGDSTRYQSVPLKPALKSRRTVRLTVLPPLEGSANTTTSHGGLLEVEDTGETVEASQRAYAARMLRLQALEAEAHQHSKVPTMEPEQAKPPPEKLQTNSTSSQRNMRAERRYGTTMRVVPASRVQHATSSRNNAVLAAVGAGMIPATVAMLLPMVLGRRRRKRETHYEPVPLTVVETPHRRRRKPVKKIIVRKKPTEVVYY